MAHQTQPRFSFEEYLAAEREEAEIRHENIAGEVYDVEFEG